MVNVRPVIHIIGLLGCCVAAAQCVPALADFALGYEEWHQFLFAATVSGFLGTATALATRMEGRVRLNLRQAFLVTSLGWVVVAVLGAIPFSGLGMSPTDALFESMSGITTTGSTVLVGLDSLPPGILLWRALLQWIGGIGIIAVAILILPLLRVGGMQLFRIEGHDPDRDPTAGATRTIATLGAVYAGLTGACAALYYLFGMSFFDAVTHAMTTLSTGGYSTHDSSFAHFGSLSLQWVGTVFMLLGAIPFFLYVKAVRGNCRDLVTDQQVRGFLAFIAVSGLIMGCWLGARLDIGLDEAVTLTFFNMTSIVTTTGFASADYSSWGPGAVGVFLALMFVGGCSGSTSGAIKVYRYQVLFMVVRKHVKRLFMPHRALPLRYNGKTLPDDVPYSILAFITVFIGTIAVFTVCLSLLGLDIVTAYSASVTAITNVGPGLGGIVGPAGNFSPLPDAAKWILTCAMLAGRLEVLVLLVAFDRDFWR